MTDYKIERWDSVIYGNSTRPYPMIYIKPDLAFLEFVKANNYKIKVLIKGTGQKSYDDYLIDGIVDSSASTPTCRPNYFNETGYYVITLLNPWAGYPPLNMFGTCKIYGENDKIDIKPNEDKNEEDKKEDKKEEDKKEIPIMLFNINRLYNRLYNRLDKELSGKALIIIFLFFLLICFLIYRNTTNKHKVKPIPNII